MGQVLCNDVQIVNLTHYFVVGHTRGLTGDILQVITCSDKHLKSLLVELVNESLLTLYFHGLIRCQVRTKISIELWVLFAWAGDGVVKHRFLRKLVVALVDSLSEDD